MDSPMSKIYDKAGFTLIELLIVLAISGIVFAAIYAAFDSHQRTKVNEQMLINMQQNSRAALFMIQRDLRMAGLDETWEDGNTDGLDDNRLADGIDNDCTGGPDNAGEEDDLGGILDARSNYIRFLQDRNADSDFCDPDDQIAYALGSPNADSDGIADSSTDRLSRGIADGSLIPLAEDVQAVSFGYAFDFDGGAFPTDGVIDTNGGNVLWAYDSDGDGDLDVLLDSNNDGWITQDDDLDGNGYIDDVILATEVPIQQIRAVRIWVLASTRSPLRGADPDMNTYIVGDKVVIPGDTNGNGFIDAGDDPDRHRRLLLSSTVYCRNLGVR
jgi:type IV pilus assembly protein PilW